MAPVIGGANPWPRRSGAGRVVVATDDARVIDAARAHGVDAVLTRADHATGTDRLAEAAGALGLADDAIVVNVQGDEPLLAPALIARVASLLASSLTRTWSTEETKDAGRRSSVLVSVDSAL